MTRYLTKRTVVTTWLLALLAALWLAVGATSPLAWFALAFIGLLPPTVLMVLTQTPEKSMAEIIRDVDAGRSR